MPCGGESAGGTTLTGGPGAIAPGGTPGAVPGGAIAPRGGTIGGAGMRDEGAPDACPEGGGVFGGGIAGAAWLGLALNATGPGTELPRDHMHCVYATS